ncbi:MAG: ribosome assembly RNA-binding protein YhbY [Defluviitaleaceae bacterium]|nr:ribosome assembly RNA-binding protein YhbY [Defluviitaleaceae bacterium]
MLTGKQKSFLKSQAHEMQPIIQIGKGLVSQTVIDTVSKALEARELIKISVLQNCLAEPKEIATVIAEQTDAHVVQVIGRVMILYKKSSKPTHQTITRKLPK